MSFSGEIKKELMENASFSCPDCAFCFCYGLFCFAPRRQKEYLWSTSSRPLADLAAQSLAEAAGYIVTVIGSARRDGQEPSCRIYLQNAEDQADFQSRFAELPLERFCAEKLGRSCCRGSFLRGVFFSCGTVVNPQRQYQMEFLCHSPRRAALLKELLVLMGFSPKLAGRSRQAVVYFKESEQIEDLLTTMGAGLGAMAYMNAKIEKDFRNRANRAANCDTANIQKVVNAAVRQAEDIRLIEQTVGLENLSDELRLTARARLENPDASLRELCQALGGDITRSGLNHRLARLSKMADQLRQREKKP